MGRAYRFVVRVFWWVTLTLLAVPPALAAEENLSTEGISRASDSVVGVVSVAVDNASSSATLGPVRKGSGVVIGPEGLVLTIGYLILEADQVLLLGHPLRPADPRAWGAARAGPS